MSVLREADGSVPLGCDPKEYEGHEGELVVTVRGTCACVGRAVYGQQAGAAAVLMIHSAATCPPVEGMIISTPTRRGVRRDDPVPRRAEHGHLPLLAADAGTATLTDTQLANSGSAAASLTPPRFVQRRHRSEARRRCCGPLSSSRPGPLGTGDGPATISGMSTCSR